MTQNIDIVFSQSPDGLYDLTIDPTTGDRAGTEGLQTAILLSTFCERRAEAAEVSQPELRRGWVGNLVGEHASAGFEYGSKLWLLEQSRLSQQTVNRAIDYLKSAYQWFIDDGMVQHIGVTGEKTGTTIAARITFVSPENVIETKLFDLVNKTVH